jgi:small subunit ribosomal protein S7
MARKGGVRKREVLPDVMFNKELITKFINCIMRDGKKGVAERIVYKAFESVEKKLKSEPFPIFEQALQNIRPSIEVKPRRVGGATYQVPTDVPEVRGIALALKWTIDSAKKRSEKTMEEKLAHEIMDAYSNRGGAITVRINTEKMAEANRAFAHFRW